MVLNLAWASVEYRCVVLDIRMVELLYKVLLNASLLPRKAVCCVNRLFVREISLRPAKTSIVELWRIVAARFVICTVWR